MYYIMSEGIHSMESKRYTAIMIEIHLYDERALLFLLRASGIFLAGGKSGYRQILACIVGHVAKVHVLAESLESIINDDGSLT